MMNCLAALTCVGRVNLSGTGQCDCVKMSLRLKLVSDFIHPPSMPSPWTYRGKHQPSKLLLAGFLTFDLVLSEFTLPSSICRCSRTPSTVCIPARRPTQA